MKAAAIEFRQVTKRYGDVVAVNGVSFTIGAGTLVTLLGPSGCGKTTILRMLAGLELPSSGTIRIGDEDVTARAAAERDVSMVFQSYALFPHMSVLENVRYGLVVSGKPKARSRRAGARRARHRGPHRPRRAASLRALRRPAAACGRRARARAGAVGAAVRRAAVESRRSPSPADARGDPRSAAAPQSHGRLRDARPVGGDGRVGPHHRDGQGGHRAGRRAARALRAAARLVRRRFHGRCQSRARHDRPPRRDARGRDAGSGDAVAAARRRRRRRMRGRHSPGSDRASLQRRCARFPPP